MKSTTFHCNTPAELNSKLAQLQNSGFRATLALCFADIALDFEVIQAAFLGQKIDFIGCSSAGEIVDAGVHENGIGCMLFDLDRRYYEVFTAEAGADRNTYQICFDAGQEAKQAFENPGVLLLSGGMFVDAEQLVFGLKDGVGREIPFYGGLAGDSLQMNRTVSFSNNFQSENGIVCLVLDTDRVEMTGMAISGWKAIGGEHVITEANGNVLMRINGQPALDVFLKNFGFFDNTQHNDEPITTLSAQYPLQLEREGGVTVLRSPMSADYTTRSLILAGGVREGERFRFSIAPGFEVVDQTLEEFIPLSQKTTAAEAVLLFSCKGRHAALGPVIEDEVEGLFKKWNVPMIGFFTYGEIGNTRTGVCEFHNETCSLVVLREKGA